jgi:hypothetical protein
MRENGFYWIIFEGVKQVAEYSDYKWYITGSGNSYSDYVIEKIISKEPLEYPKTFKL